QEVMRNLIAEISGVMTKTTEIYSKTIMATLNEDRRTLREMVRESNDLFYNAREKKYALLPTLQKLQDNYIEAGHFYVQVVDYISEMSKALVHITRPCFEHIDNNHKGMSEEQVEDLLKINDKVSEIYARINVMLNDNDYSDTNVVLEMRDELFVTIDDAVKSQLRRIQNKATSTKASMLYLTILNERRPWYSSRNLLKSQRRSWRIGTPPTTHGKQISQQGHSQGDGRQKQRGTERFVPFFVGFQQMPRPGPSRERRPDNRHPSHSIEIRT
ncbi:MAG: hypothetical protein ACLUZZ_06815, partial [Alistipes inops]